MTKRKRYMQEPKLIRTLDFTMNNSAHAQVRAVFRNHECTLVSMINQHKGGFILVAMAWFTNQTVLNALVKAKRRGVNILVVVQKEDFLRPDSCGKNQLFFASALRSFYESLGTYTTMSEEGDENIVDLLKSITCEHDDECVREFIWENKDDRQVEAVRCLGNHNSTNNPSHPRMHHKFIVFGQWGKSYEDEIHPEMVWTGSYNCSKTAELSFENIVVINSDEVARQYMKEFVYLFRHSEPLDWTAKWMAPNCIAHS